jgi:uroporphyrinogen-III synthase
MYHDSRLLMLIGIQFLGKFIPSSCIRRFRIGENLCKTPQDNACLFDFIKSCRTSAYLCRMRVFISRECLPGSLFYDSLSARGYTVTGQSLLQLTPLPVQDIPGSDWIFFASGNAVRFFFELPTAILPERGAVKWAALGPATAITLRTFTKKVDFEGDGRPDACAAAFASLAGGQTVLFPAAQHSQRSVQKMLGDQIQVIDLALYANAPLPDITPRTEAILLFTSPMNARAYFSKNTRLPEQRIIVIGASTAKALQELRVGSFEVSEFPDEGSLVEMVLTF